MFTSRARARVSTPRKSYRDAARGNRASERARGIFLDRKSR